MNQAYFVCAPDCSLLCHPFLELVNIINYRNNNTQRKSLPLYLVTICSHIAGEFLSTDGGTYTTCIPFSTDWNTKTIVTIVITDRCEITLIYAQRYCVLKVNNKSKTLFDLG